MTDCTSKINIIKRFICLAIPETRFTLFNLIYNENDY